VGHLRHALARQSKGSDVPIDVHFADAYEVKDGKIVRAIIGYPDVATALEAVGLA
jgi:ketosteroid isomerase-like protein